MNLSDAIGLEIERREKAASDWRTDTVEELYKQGHRLLRVTGVGEVEIRQDRIDALLEEIEKLRDPGWKEYISLTEKWLEKYPADIFYRSIWRPRPAVCCRHS